MPEVLRLERQVALMAMTHALARRQVEMVRESGMDEHTSTLTLAQRSAFAQMSRSFPDPYKVAEMLVLLGAPAMEASQLAYRETRERTLRRVRELQNPR